MNKEIAKSWLESEPKVWEMSSDQASAIAQHFANKLEELAFKMECYGFMDAAQKVKSAIQSII